jgi:hypothetical protein
VTEADLLKEFQNEVNLALVPSLGVEVCQPLEDTLKIGTQLTIFTIGKEQDT